jgi:hypothetical protein
LHQVLPNIALEIQPIVLQHLRMIREVLGSARHLSSIGHRDFSSPFGLSGLSRSTRIRIPSSGLGSSSMFFVQNKIDRTPDPWRWLFATPDNVVDSRAKHNASQQSNNRLAIISGSSFGKLVSALIKERYEITFC